MIFGPFYSVSQKKIPPPFSDIFPKRFGIFNFFTHLLYDHFYTITNVYSNISNFDKVMPY